MYTQVTFSLFPIRVLTEENTGSQQQGKSIFMLPQRIVRTSQITSKEIR